MEGLDDEALDVRPGSVDDVVLDAGEHGARVEALVDAALEAAGDAGELRKVYDGLASRVSTRDTERELTVYLVALALLIVMAGATTSMRWFARPA